MLLKVEKTYEIKKWCHLEKNSPRHCIVLFLLIFFHLKFFASSTNFIKGIINIGVCEYIDNSSIKITVEDEKYVATLYDKQDGEYIPILLTTGNSS